MNKFEQQQRVLGHILATRVNEVDVAAIDAAGGTYNNESGGGYTYTTGSGANRDIKGPDPVIQQYD